MNILYISKLLGCPSAGPTYSIPAQVSAQSKIDNVFWYNLATTAESNWKESLQNIKNHEPTYHDLDDYPEGKINRLPVPFCNPDIIVVEQMYKYATLGIRKELIRNSFPFVLIPRGELTDDAQRQKSIKKIIFNRLIFFKFSNAATAIQYLTSQEESNSSNKWNKSSIVIPNGTIIPETNADRRTGCKKGINMVFIGRINKYHKGLDLLLEAAAQVRDSLTQNNCRIKVYGPDDLNQVSELISFCRNNELEEIVSFEGPVVGKEKTSVLQESDVFLMPSRFEGHPTGLLEALAYGLPCVATTGSNMRKEIELADAGWTADNDAESIKNALLSMISDKDKFMEKGRNARNLAKEYDWNAIARKTHDVYENLLRGNMG